MYIKTFEIRIVDTLHSRNEHPRIFTLIKFGSYLVHLHKNSFKKNLTFKSIPFNKTIIFTKVKLPSLVHKISFYKNILH